VKNLFITLSFIIFISGCGKIGGGGAVTIKRINKYTSVTIMNGTDQSVNLAGWKLVEIRQIIASPDDTNTYVIPAGVVANGAEISYSASSAGLMLGADETVYLYDNTGKRVSQMSWMFFTP